MPQSHPLVDLARRTIESYVTGSGRLQPPEDPDETMRQRAGVFVSIKKHGRLRGCIGTFAPTQRDVASETIANAIAAATRDPRFDPVEPGELGDLAISVDVLSAPEKVDSPDELDPKRYGVIVTRGARRGLLLPDLEGVDTVEEQISIAMRKAGIRPGETGIELERFEVRRYR